MTTTLILILAIACVLLFSFMAWLEMRQFSKEREAWQKERAKLLDRIQSGGLAEFMQERAAETPPNAEKRRIYSKNGGRTVL